MRWGNYHPILSYFTRPPQLYAWQKAAQQPLPTDPAEAAEVRALRTANKRLAQELDILKKAIAIFSHPLTP